MTQSGSSDEAIEETGIGQRAKKAALFFLPVCAFLSMVVSKFYAAYPFWETIFEARESGPSIWEALSYPETRASIVPFYLCRFVFPALSVAVCYIFFPFSTDRFRKAKELPVKKILVGLAVLLVAISLVARIRSLSVQNRELAGELYSTEEQLDTLETEKQRLLDEASTQVGTHQAEIATIKEAHKTEIAQKEKQIQDLIWQLEGLQDAAGQIKALTARAEKAEARAANFEGQIEAERQADIAEANERSHAWDQIRLGMTPTQVESLLGIPKKIFGTEVYRVYYYGNYPNGPEVQFSDGKVSGWDKP